jgi:uncharacterized protein YegP (UPF0339 family)
MNKAIAYLLAAMLLCTLGLSIHTVVAQQKKSDAKEQAKKAKATAVIELYKDKSEMFRFRVKDDAEELLAISAKGYETKVECQKVIRALQKVAAEAKVQELTN